MKYDSEQILGLTEKSLRIAKTKLSELPVFCGCEPSIGGLHGWVYEQAVQLCLKQELAALRLKPESEEQVRFGGRAKADFRLGHVLVEVKTSGLFGRADAERYGKYRLQAEGKGYRYLFVTAYERYEPYRRAILEAVGKRNVFILNQPGEWRRLVATVAQELQRKSRSKGTPQ